MADYPYATVVGKLKSLLEKIKTLGVPNQANTTWLKTIGYKSTNDRTILTVLRFINFIDSASTPTKLWSKYRGKNSSAILAQGIKEGYAELFATYPEANRLSNDDLSHFFSTHSKAGEQAIRKTATTFRALCDLADFESNSNLEEITTETVGVEEEKAIRVNRSNSKANASDGKTPPIHINVQIHISADSSPEQIDQIFSSMSKYLANS